MSARSDEKDRGKEAFLERLRENGEAAAAWLQQDDAELQETVNGHVRLEQQAQGTVVCLEFSLQSPNRSSPCSHLAVSHLPPAHAPHV